MAKRNFIRQPAEIAVTCAGKQMCINKWKLLLLARDQRERFALAALMSTNGPAIGGA